MTLTKGQRAELYAMFGGLCAYCGQTLPEKGWHADHIEAVNREWWKATKWWQDAHGKQPIGMESPENDHFGNMFPACRACNIDKSVYPLEDWRKTLERKVDVLRDNYSAYRHAERFGLVAQVKTKVVFHFETVGVGPQC